MKERNKELKEKTSQDRQDEEIEKLNIADSSCFNYNNMTFSFNFFH